MKRWLKTAATWMVITALLLCAIYPVSANAFSPDTTLALSFGGEGTQTVNVNRTYPSRTFRLIVKESATYQIVTGTAQRTYLELLDANSNSLLFDSAERYGDNTCITAYLEAETIYYIFTYAYDVMSKGGISYPLTVQNTTALAQGKLFKNESISVRRGDIVDPVFLAGTSGDITLRSSAPDIMYIDEDGHAVAVHDGYVELIATDKNGVTDTLSVQINGTRTLLAMSGRDSYSSLNYGALHEDIVAYAFEFAIVEHNSTRFTVYSQGTCDLAAVLYANDGNVAGRTAKNARGNFVLSASGAKPDTLRLLVTVNNTFEQEDSFAVIITTGTPEMETASLALYDNTYVGVQGNRYTVYRGQEVWLNGVDGYTVPDGFTDKGNGVLVPTVTGTYTLTKGDTTLQLVVVDYVKGDLTADGAKNMRDALKLYQISSGVAASDETTTALSDITGDNVVNMRDALKLYQDVSNNSGGETEKDPIVGDEVEDDW